MNRPRLLIIISAITFIVSVFFGQNCSAQTKKDSTKKEYIHERLEQEPYFPHYSEFIKANLKYPEKAKQAGIMGSVILTFTVEKDGCLTNFKIVKSLSPECDAEAIRIFKSMPCWTPGRDYYDQPMQVAYQATVKFDPED